jgi:hypothetical protein
MVLASWAVSCGGSDEAAGTGARTPADDRAASSSPAPTADGSETLPAGAKIDLWRGGARLRGANIWQAHVDHSVYEGVYGSSPVGPPFTQEDFNRLSALGANYVNISHPGLFSEDPPYGLDEDAQANLDRLLEMIANADMFAVIAFRTGPGRAEFTFNYGESLEEAGDEVGWFHRSDYNDRVWQDREAQAAWARMWRHTAERYRENPVVAGYELMVEPNANEVLYDQWDAESYYREHAGEVSDWNNIYPTMVQAIREVDDRTPILVSPMSYSSLSWLSELTLSTDPLVIYSVHQYEPLDYTHQEPPLDIRYPGTMDLDGDGEEDSFDTAFITETIYGGMRRFQEEDGMTLAVTETGLIRYEPGAERFMSDQLAQFDRLGVGTAVWEWSPAFLDGYYNDDFNLLHGADPQNHDRVEESDCLDVLRRYWSQNRDRPSNTGF